MRSSTLPFKITLVTVLAAAAGLAWLMLAVGSTTGPRWLARLILFYLWAVSPFGASLLLAWRLRRTRWAGQCAAMFVFASIVGAAATYQQAFFVSESSTAGLALLFVPLWHWLLLTFFGLAVMTVLWLGKRLRH